MESEPYMYLNQTFAVVKLMVYIWVTDILFLVDLLEN